MHTRSSHKVIPLKSQVRLTRDQKDLARFAIHEGIFLNSEKFNAAKESLFADADFYGERITTKKLLESLVADGWNVDEVSQQITKGHITFPASILGYWGIRYAVYLDSSGTGHHPISAVN